MVLRRGVTSDALMNSTCDVIGFVTESNTTSDIHFAIHSDNNHFIIIIIMCNFLMWPK